MVHSTDEGEGSSVRSPKQVRKYTKAPWTIGYEDYNANTIYGGGEGICQMYGVPMNVRVEDVSERYEKGMANAARIVHCVNIHDELVEALAWYVENDDTNETLPHNAFYIEGKNKALSVLAKARGKE